MTWNGFKWSLNWFFNLNLSLELELSQQNRFKHVRFQLTVSKSIKNRLNWVGINQKWQKSIKNNRNPLVKLIDFDFFLLFYWHFNWKMDQNPFKLIEKRSKITWNHNQQYNFDAQFWIRQILLFESRRLGIQIINDSILEAQLPKLD